MSKNIKTSDMREANLFIESFQLPHNPNLPLLIYRNVLEETATDSIGLLLRKNDWHKIWVDGIYNFSHFHSNIHEVLALSEGQAQVEFGDERIIEVQAGDVIFIPAGVPHKNLKSSNDFLVVGGYPFDIDYDMCKKMDEKARKAIQNVKLPMTDPIFGKNGPLFKYWCKTNNN